MTTIEPAASEHLGRPWVSQGFTRQATSPLSPSMATAPRGTWPSRNSPAPLAPTA